MELLDPKANEPAFAFLEGIQFGLVTNEEFQQVSVFDSTQLVKVRDLYDSRLGLPAYEERCSTCGACKGDDCPGHFGHFPLSTQVYHPEHVHFLQQILNKICPSCCRMRKRKKDLFMTELHDHEVQSEGSCKYCRNNARDNEVKYPELKFKLVKKEFDKRQVDTIEMEVNEKHVLPSDFWGFIDKSKDFPGRPRFSRPLLPVEALRILKKIPEHTRKRLDIASNVEACILKCVPIPPNCMRVIERKEPKIFLTTHGISQRSQKLSLVLTKSNSIKSGRTQTGSFYAEYFESCKLQGVLADYFKTSKIGAEAEEEPVFRKREHRKNTHTKFHSKSGPKWFKKNILGKRSDYSARCPLSGDPCINMDELAIPLLIARRLHVPERVTRLNWMKLKDYAGLGQKKKWSSTFVTQVARDGKRFKLHNRNEPWQLEMGDVVYRQLKDGDLVFANRSPSIHKHSLIGFRVKILNRPTIAINPLICAPFAADFDGDAIHIFVPQSNEAIAEVSEIMSLPRQMICSQGGQALVGFSQDSLLATHMLLSSCFMFDKKQFQKLCTLCSKNLPRPAILKAPNSKGSLWTGFQLFSMALPDRMNYVNSTKKSEIIIKEGEILKCKEFSWLQNSSNGLVRKICDVLGPHEALRYLDTAQSILREWMDEKGFTVGLDDIYLSDDFNSRKKMMDEVITGLEEAKRCSEKALLLFHSEVQKEITYSGTDMSSVCLSKCGSSRELFISIGDTISRIPPLYLQTVTMNEFCRIFAEIEKVIKWHIAPCNTLLSMVEAGSKGSFTKIIQQSGCIGLQLVEGERWISSEALVDNFWDSCGLVSSSFLEGLKLKDFFAHVLSARSFAKRQGVDEPGKLFRDSMFCLRELYASYDGTIRNKNGQYVIQFSYGGIGTDKEQDLYQETSLLELQVAAGEAVGALAATALIEPAYNITLDSGVTKKFQPLNVLKETMSRVSTSMLKKIDQHVTLRLEKGAFKRPYDMERAALRTMEHLKRITLGMLTDFLLIKYNSSWENGVEFGGSTHTSWFPWIAHIRLAEVALRRESLIAKDILKVLEREKRIGWNFSSSEKCDCKSGGIENLGPCIQYVPSIATNTHFEKMFEVLNSMKFIILPIIMKTVVKGDLRIESATIDWEENAIEHPNSSTTEELKTHLNQQPGDLVVKIRTKNVSKRGKAWNIITDCCRAIVEIIDWKRSEPYSIPEICSILGIEAARKCIYERLKFCMKGMGRHVDEKHFCLIADYMTHTGHVLSLTAAGFRAWHRLMCNSAPFTQGSFSDPKGTFFGAARKDTFDNLCGMLGSLVWGKDANMHLVDLFWSSPEEVTQQQKDNDICHFLDANHEKMPAVLSDIKSKNLYAQSGLDMEFSPLHHSSEDELEFAPGFEPFDLNPVSPQLPCSFGDTHESEGRDERQTADCELAENDDKPVCEEVLPSCSSRDEKIDSNIVIGMERIDLSNLASSVHIILHKRYNIGDELAEDDKKLILEEVLPYHPDWNSKIGCGIASIKVDYSLKHPTSRCFMLVREDGSFDDFSYHKCLKGLEESKSSTI